MTHNGATPHGRDFMVTQDRTFEDVYTELKQTFKQYDREEDPYRQDYFRALIYDLARELVGEE